MLAHCQRGIQQNPPGCFLQICLTTGQFPAHTDAWGCSSPGADIALVQRGNMSPFLPSHRHGTKPAPSHCSFQSAHIGWTFWHKHLHLALKSQVLWVISESSGSFWASLGPQRTVAALARGCSHLGRFQLRVSDLQGHPHLAALADKKCIAAESDVLQ